jgi:small-conductance mechanosensitive channel
MDFGNSVQQGFDRFFAFLPNLLGFIVILIVGYVIARVVAGITGKALEKLGLDRRLHESEAHNYVEKVLPGASPSKGIAAVVFWLVFAFFIVAAIGALQIPAVTTFMNQVLAYLPNVIVAILIFVIASIIAGAVAAAATRLMGDTPTGKVVAGVVPALVMVIAMFMILNQLHIAEQIVTIAFAATMFALALGLALAFGLGGRDVARRLLEDAYANGQRARQQMRSDAQTGRARAQEAMDGSDSSSTLSGSGATAAGYGTGTTETGTGWSTTAQEEEDQYRTRTFSTDPSYRPETERRDYHR